MRCSVRLLTQCFLVLAGLVADVVAQPGGGLFVAEPRVAAAHGPERGSRSAATVLRQRFAGIDREILTAARLHVDRAVAEPAVVRLNLFDDVVLDAVVQDTGPTSAGYWLAGHIEGSPPGSLILVVNNEIVAGFVTAPGGTYSIRSTADGVLAIQQIDLLTLRGMERVETLMPSSPPGPEPDRIQPITWPPPSSQAAAPSDEEDGSRIDVLVVYNPDARNYFGGYARPGIRAVIDLAVAGTNKAFAESGVIQRIHLVSAQEVDDLRGKGIERKERLRDQFTADIVFEVDGDPERCGDLGGCGGASVTLYESLQGEVLTFGRLAYAFLGVDYMNPLNFAHELGHVMGIWHDRYTEKEVRPGVPAELRQLPRVGTVRGQLQALQLRLCEPAGFRCRGADIEPLDNAHVLLHAVSRFGS